MFGCIIKVYREATAHRMSMTKPPKFTGNLLNPSRYSIIPVDLVRYSIIGRLQNPVTSLLGGAGRAATYQTVAFFLSYRLL